MKYVLIFLFSIFVTQTYAVEHDNENPGVSAGVVNAAESDQQLVSYPASFFDRYKPTTALDMVKQLPGFLLDDGSSVRGFGNAIGNILINDKYPSAKQVSPSSILSRIPASQVASVEVIRGQVRGIDLQGQSVLANIILRTDIPAAVQWEFFVLHASNGPIKPGLNISLSDRWRDIDYNLGMDLERGANGEKGPETVYDGDGNIIENRFDTSRETGLRLLGIFLNSSTWIGDTLVQLNTKAGMVRGPEIFNSSRTPVNMLETPELVSIKYSEISPSLEIGVDAERALSPYLTGKAIFLFTRNNSQFTTRQRTSDQPADIQTLYRESDSRRMEKEGITRFELDWSGLPKHLLQLNLEGAINTLDGSLFQTRDSGTGPVIVIVPGANSNVEEVRGDLLIKDTWDLGKFELAYGLGAEVSTITQTGDVDLERNFFFVKPQAVLTYSSSESQQLRLMLRREVSQLNFNDFVSASVFEDNDLALGNPDLRPERTWVSELSNEWRAGKNNVYTLSFYYHRINDVEDLLPLTEDFEVPGNIGNGKRWGIRFESTLPLEWLGIKNAKLDLKVRWQESSVIDPVTGNERQFTADGGFSGPPNIKIDGENKYAFDVAYRQDFQNSQIAWGWDIAEQARRPRFKVNELEIFNEGLETNVFIETTRYLGIKIRLEGRNLLNYDEVRDRFLYEGERDLTPLSSRILRERRPGWRINLVLSGSF
jgi:hypothetical protein